MPDETQPGEAAERQGFQILQNCPESVVLLDQDLSVVYANRTFHDRFCSTAATEGTSFLSYLDPPSAKQVQELREQLFHGVRQMELVHVLPSTRAVRLQYSFFPLPVPESGPRLVAGMGRDRINDLGSLLEVIQLNIDLERKQKELSEANARLEQLAITDQITSLYNRHHFFQVAQHSWEEARRYKLPLTAIMIDIDNFKSVNDTHGHMFGDHVLAQACLRLRNNTRKSDILARYGGEEIILLAPHTDFPTGLVLAERMRLAMASEPFVMGRCGATVTISVGISGTELGEFENFEALLESCDRALYGAKRAGKNCVYAYNETLASQL